MKELEVLKEPKDGIRKTWKKRRHENGVC